MVGSLEQGHTGLGADRGQPYMHMDFGPNHEVILTIAICGPKGVGKTAFLSSQATILPHKQYQPAWVRSEPHQLGWVPIDSLFEQDFLKATTITPWKPDAAAPAASLLTLQRHFPEPRLPDRLKRWMFYRFVELDFEAVTPRSLEAVIFMPDMSPDRMEENMRYLSVVRKSMEALNHSDRCRSDYQIPLLILINRQGGVPQIPEESLAGIGAAIVHCDLQERTDISTVLLEAVRWAYLYAFECYFRYEIDGIDGNICKENDAEEMWRGTHELSASYSSRYFAGLALHLPSEKLQKCLGFYLDQLKQNLQATLTQLPHPKSVPHTGTAKIIDEKKRLAAFEDLLHLYRRLKAEEEQQRKKQTGEVDSFPQAAMARQLIEQTYKTNACPKVAWNAGETLGYGKLRLCLHRILLKCRTTI